MKNICMRRSEGLGSARVSRVWQCRLYISNFSCVCHAHGKFAKTRRLRQHANRVRYPDLLVIALSVVSALPTSLAGSSFTFGGVPFAAGSTVRANVPLSAQEKSLATQGGNTVPANAVSVLATPPNFDPQKTWPVLVVCSTSDNKRQNRDDLADFYRRVALPEGWVVLAGDGPQRPRSDTAAWRGAMTLAAVDALHHSFPGAEKWPIACAGFSGGGKGAGYIAPLLAKSGCHVTGIYMTGVNEEHLTDGYTKIRPGPGFLNTPIYVAIGHEDRIAPQEQQYAVVSSIKKGGFTRVRIGEFRGGHEANDAQTAIALHWFRDLAK
jgi:hypothetical protein